jgi:hypothetical protein
MGQEPGRVKRSLESPRGPESLEEEIRQTRNTLSGLVAELDRRRHRFFATRFRTARVAAIGAMGAGIVIVTVYRMRRRRRSKAIPDLVRRATSPGPRRAMIGGLLRILAAAAPFVAKSLSAGRRRR